jgi:glycosyltransferase involved in cell wall biosynthesis
VNSGSKNVRLLIVSYWFPPTGGIPVQRMLSLARYLPQYGIEVHVLTPRNPPAPQLDPSLLKLIPPGVTIHRTFTPMPPSKLRRAIWKLLSPRAKAGTGKPVEARKSGGGGWKSWPSNIVRRLLSPDPEVVWTPFARRKARQIVKRYGIDTVMVSAPPFSSFLVGNWLKREFPHLRMVADFRDDWLHFFLATFDFQKSSHIRRQAEVMERETVENSDRVVLVTNSWVNGMRGRYPDVPPEKFACIANGFDPAAFAGFQARPHRQAGFVVAYIGTVYSTTSPKPYLEALDALPEEVRGMVETRFVGRITDEERPLLENRKSSIKALGFMPQKEALRHAEEADFLLLTMTDPDAATGKIYEYLATGKPILAIAPAGGEVDLIIRETRAGWCVSPDDPAAVQSLLMQAFDPSRKLLVSFNPNREAICAYERPRLAGVYADLIKGSGDR